MLPGNCWALTLEFAGWGAAAQDAPNSKADPAAIFQQGKQALQSGQLSAAEVAFQRVIGLDPKSAAAYINLGVVHIRQKRWDDAIATLRKAEALAPNEPGVQLNIGLAYYRKSDFGSAITPFSESLRLAPDSLQSRYLLGLCYFFTNRYSEAAETLAPIWDRESGNLNYLYVLSIAASKSSNPSLEKQAIDRMVAVGQDTPEFHLYVGKAWLAEDDTKKALKEFESAAEAKPSLPLVHYFLGRTYLEQRDYPRAEAELLKDVAIEPEFAYNYEDLGILYAQRGEMEKAEHYFREAIARNSALVNSYFGLAKLYRDGAKYSAALEMLDPRRSAGSAERQSALHARADFGEAGTGRKG